MKKTFDELLFMELDRNGMINNTGRVNINLASILKNQNIPIEMQKLILQYSNMRNVSNETKKHFKQVRDFARGELVAYLYSIAGGGEIDNRHFIDLIIGGIILPSMILGDFDKLAAKGLCNMVKIKISEALNA
jgi:hypothetical protein